jgi:hypothetical protein
MNRPIRVGDTVRMVETMPDHDIVKFRNYEVIAETGSSLTIRDYLTLRVFTGRVRHAFFIYDEPGPW